MHSAAARLSFYAGENGKMGCYEDYDRINLFYQSLGFEEMEMLPLWDEQNP